MRDYDPWPYDQQNLMFDRERLSKSNAIRRHMSQDGDASAPDALGIATFDHRDIQIFGIPSGCDPIINPDGLTELADGMSRLHYAVTLRLFVQLRQVMPIFPSTGKMEFLNRIKAESGVELNRLGGIVVHRDIPAPAGH